MASVETWKTFAQAEHGGVFILYARDFSKYGDDVPLHE